MLVLLHSIMSEGKEFHALIEPIKNELKKLKFLQKTGLGTLVGINTLHAEIIYTSLFINAEIKIICLRSK